MNIICLIFGHRPAFGWYHSEGNGYFDVECGAVDGVGRQHATLYIRCERCSKKYQVGKIHIPEIVQLKEDNKKLSNKNNSLSSTIATAQENVKILNTALEISYDYLKGHWDMNSVPLTKISEALALVDKKELVDECEHNWVSADNEYVTGAEVCLICKTIRTKPQNG